MEGDVLHRGDVLLYLIVTGSRNIEVPSTNENGLLVRACEDLLDRWHLATEVPITSHGRFSIYPDILRWRLYSVDPRGGTQRVSLKAKLYRCGFCVFASVTDIGSGLFGGL